jgi:hypothetical protein
MDEDAIRTLVGRLARPDASGGVVVERSVIRAQGNDSAAIIDWILAHSGVPDSTAAASARAGLHGPRTDRLEDPSTRPALRFVLPAGALAESPPAQPAGSTTTPSRA